jgi:acetyltransferase-like isoleucine patch superfamily enzyme
VTKDVPPYTVVAGVPAKPIKVIGDDAQAKPERVIYFDK